MTLWTESQYKRISTKLSEPAGHWASMSSSVPVVKSATAMKILSMVVTVVLGAAIAVAQSDLCWRDPYPWIPGEWAGSGSVVEAGNRFQVVPGATVELWSTTYRYDDAHKRTIRHQVLPASLVETTQSNVDGAFVLNTLRPSNKLQPSSYEIRVRMPGRESAKAYTQIGGPGPQWMGRGIKVALSQEGKGCPRIYSAGRDDTDCGVLDCEKLPPGRTKIVFSDGTPLADTRLDFYQHSKKRSQNPEFSLKTDSSGMVTTPRQRGCFDVAIEHGGSMHLCFSGLQPSGLVTVMLPSRPVQ